jgi:hypothetical protein
MALLLLIVPDQCLPEVMANNFTFTTKAEAIEAAQALGLEGSHTHKGQSGELLYMPGKSHKEFMESQQNIDEHNKKSTKSKFLAARDALYKKRLEDMGAYRKYSDGKKKKKPYSDDMTPNAGEIGRNIDEVL